MWLALLQKVLRKGTRLSSVNALGGRNSVLLACRNDQATTNRRRRIYLIDADMDFLLGRGTPRLQHLYRINAYCIENLALNERSAVAVALQHCTNNAPPTVVQNLNFSAWISDVHKALRPLFIIYAVSMAAGASSQRTVGKSVHHLLVQTATGPELCKKKISRTMRAIARDVRQTVGLAEFCRLRREVTNRAARLNEKKSISGKSYLAPLLWLRLQRIAQFRGTLDQMILQLSGNFAPSWDRAFARRLSRV